MNSLNGEYEDVVSCLPSASLIWQFEPVTMKWQRFLRRAQTQDPRYLKFEGTLLFLMALVDGDFGF
jgi:hypothetical protein